MRKVYIRLDAKHAACSAASVFFCSIHSGAVLLRDTRSIYQGAIVLSCCSFGRKARGRISVLFECFGEERRTNTIYVTAAFGNTGWTCVESKLSRRSREYIYVLTQSTQHDWMSFLLLATCISLNFSARHAVHVPPS